MTRISAYLCLCSLCACAATPLAPGAAPIFVSSTEPPPGCVFVAEVLGSQGNFWSADFTSDANLIAGARNELRNAAAALGADYVRVETESFSHNTADDSFGGTYSAVVVGNAYRCGARTSAID